MRKSTKRQPFRATVLGILFQTSLVAFTFLLVTTYLTDRYLQETGAQREAHLKQVTEVAGNTLAPVVARLAGGEISREAASRGRSKVKYTGAVTPQPSMRCM